MARDISIVIPARNEHPQATFTLQSIWDALEGSRFDWETILVCDSCTDADKNHPEDRTGGYAEKRYWGAKGRHRVVRGKWGSCWKARNAGIRVAEGSLLFLFDAHVLVSPNVFEQISSLFQNRPSATICYVPVIWMGDSRRNTCYGYNLKMEEKFWGSWTRRKQDDVPYQIPMSGTAGIAIRRTYYDTIGGWPDKLQTYGGGEQFISLLCWMLGGTCWIEPQTYLYHLADRRGYSWNNESHFYNISLVSGILGGRPWWEKTLAMRLDKSNACYHDGFRKIAESAWTDGKWRRRWVEANAQRTLDEVLAEQPWAVLQEA